LLHATACQIPQLGCKGQHSGSGDFVVLFGESATRRRSVDMGPAFLQASTGRAATAGTLRTMLFWHQAPSECGGRFQCETRCRTFRIYGLCSIFGSLAFSAGFLPLIFVRTRVCSFNWSRAKAFVLIVRDVESLDPNPGSLFEEKLQLHLTKQCHPCIAFAFKKDRCWKGDACSHCHFCTTEEAKVRRRELQEQARKLKRVRKAVERAERGEDASLWL
ncbi:unnamed protein product, partial [Symbiodinium sp. CCMP2456]